MRSTVPQSTDSTIFDEQSQVMQYLRLAQLRFEKCELKEASEAYQRAYELAKVAKNSRAMVEALVGLLRFAGESMDTTHAKIYENQLEELLKTLPQDEIPSSVWYLKGALAVFREKWFEAQTHYHHFIQMAEKDRFLPESERLLMTARALTMIGNALQQRGMLQRARKIAEILLARYEKLNLRSVNGVAYLLIGQNFEKRKDLNVAMEWYKKAHAAFLGEHNWYHHLYVLLGYARIARLQQNYAQALFYLDLIDRAAPTTEFGVLRQELAREKKRLEDSAVDLLIDSQRGLVKTREGGQITLRKQYVLLDILKALSKAHNNPITAEDRGLSKAEIIQQVWQENYRPEAHDNKLYYNINRLRKLIEPNFRQPQYLLNWKEGYRLAPGLRVQMVQLDDKKDPKVLKASVEGGKQK